MKQINCSLFISGVILVTLLGASVNAFAIGERACKNEVVVIFKHASMADVAVTPSVPVKHGALRVDWAVSTSSESARGFCKVTKGGDVVRVKTEHHKTYMKRDNSQFDGFYYDEHIGRWRDNNGDICHTCTPDNGFPAHGSEQGGGYRPPDGDIAGMQIFRNVKRNGGDYTKFTVGNLKECARACSRDHRCASFNYGKEHRDCNLKNNVPKGNPNNTVISGVKR